MYKICILKENEIFRASILDLFSITINGEIFPNHPKASYKGFLVSSIILHLVKDIT